MKEEIGKRIENIRVDMNMTKEELAKRLGISGQYLGIVERGKSSLSYEKLKILCDFSGYSSDYILFGIDSTLTDKTKKTLSEFTDEEIQEACKILNELALFIKKNE